MEASLRFNQHNYMPKTPRLSPTKVLRSLMSAVNRRNYFPRNPKRAVKVETFGPSEAIITGPKGNRIQLLICRTTKTIDVYDSETGFLLMLIPTGPFTSKASSINLTAQMLINVVNPSSLPLLAP